MTKKEKHSWGLTCILVKAMAVSCLRAQLPLSVINGKENLVILLRGAKPKSVFVDSISFSAG